jgi:phosphatidylserine/phosphatidylglycerophosphate/cardiolipin synthase-like enzyme
VKEKEVKMGIFIQRKRDGEEIVQVIPREAVVMVELLGERLVVRTVDRLGVEVRLKPNQVAGIKALLFSFAEGKVLWIKE